MTAASSKPVARKADFFDIIENQNVTSHYEKSESELVISSGNVVVPCWSTYSYGVEVEGASMMAMRIKHDFIPFGIALCSVPLWTNKFHGGEVKLLVQGTKENDLLMGVGLAMTQDALSNDICGFIQSAYFLTMSIDSKSCLSSTATTAVKNVATTAANPEQPLHDAHIHLALKKLDVHDIVNFNSGVKEGTLVHISCDAPNEVQSRKDSINQKTF